MLTKYRLSSAVIVHSYKEEMRFMHFNINQTKIGWFDYNKGDSELASREI